MSNRDPDAAYEQMEQVLEFAIEQHMKTVHTSVPGIVRVYDDDTKRAEVQIALNMMLGAVGATQAPESRPRPTVLDVPVLHPSGGGYVFRVPLEPGDAVMLHFSERGIDAFKETFDVADPPIGAMFMEHDAVASPGFGALAITSKLPGAAFQSEDGTQFVRIDKEGHIQVQATDTIRIQVGTSQIYIDDGEIWLNAGHIHLNDSGAP